jgi:hypothetical protein
VKRESVTKVGEQVIFGSLKTELEDDRPFPTRQVARMALFGFICGVCREGFTSCGQLQPAIA